MSLSLQWRRRLYFALLPVLFAVSLVTTDFKTDISAFFIAGDKAEEMRLASEMQSGVLSRRYLLSVVAIGQNTVSDAFSENLIAKFKQIDGVADVWQPGQRQFTFSDMQTVYLQHAAQLYSYHPEPVVEELFSVYGLTRRAEQLKQLLISAQSPILKPVAVQDPLLLSLQGFKKFAGQMQEEMRVNPHFRNLVLESEMTGLDYAQQKKIQQQLNNAFAELNAKHGNIYQLQMTGVPVFAAVTQELIESDVKQVTLFSTLAITALFLWLFRSFFALMQVVSLLLAVVTVSMIVTNSVFGYIHGMTMAIGTTLVGICIDYPIHALVHARSVVVDKRCSVIARIWPSMILGGITTLVGYTALGLSGYPGFQQIAVYAGTGILVSLLITRYVLPALITDTGHGNMHMSAAGWWIAFCRRFRLHLRLLLMLLSVGALLSLSKLHWIDDLEQLTPELDYLKANDRAIRSRMISSIEPGRFIIVSGDDIEAVLQKTEQLYVLLDQLKATAVLKEYYGLYPWLLSARQQRQNQLLLQQRMNEQVKAEWKSALTEQGLSVARLGNLDYSAEAPLTLQRVLDSPVRRLIDNQIFIGEQQTLVLIWIASHQPQALQTAVEQITGVQYFSQRDLLNRLAGDYRERAQIMLMAGLSVIMMLLWLCYKNLFTAVQTLLPAVLAALWILAGWALSGAAISFLHLVGLLLAVAICVDYGIFYRENRAADRILTYQAMAASMLTSALAFGGLVIARTSALQTLAGVVAMGVILGFLFCPIIISHSGSQKNNIA